MSRHGPVLTMPGCYFVLFCMVITVLPIKFYIDNHPDISLFQRTILLLVCVIFGFVLPPLIYMWFVNRWCSIFKQDTPPSKNEESNSKTDKN